MKFCYNRRASNTCKLLFFSVCHVNVYSPFVDNKCLYFLLLFFFFFKFQDRSHGSGLPEIDLLAMETCFNLYADKRDRSVDVMKFSEFMVKVHELASGKIGKEPVDGVNFASLILAQRLIDAHDEGGNGKLEYAELFEWVTEGLAMSKEEREDYAGRGGHYPASALFLEDIAHAFHS